MKSLPTLFSLVTCVGLAFAGSGAVAQTWSTPTKLSGKWTAPGSSNGQRLFVNLDPVSGTGELSIAFSEDRCSIRGAPMTMAMLGGRITLKTAAGYASMCVDSMTLEMTPNPGPKGAIGYLGELRLTGSAASRAPVLRGRLTEP